MRRILSIDGGGIRGALPASFLATLEDSLGRSVADYFDLIVGTSTGGIIALGLGAGLTANEILSFYESHGPRIFAGNRFLRVLRQIGISKYDPAPLQSALTEVFHDKKLGDSKKRLVIPSLNLDTGEVHVWKTSHHPRLERDYKSTMVEVAMATAAAPTYFPTYRSAAGVPLIDGGMWANNPIAVAVVEAIGILNWPRDSFCVLSLGCGTTPLDVGLGRVWGLGSMYWAVKIAGVFMTAQEKSALGMAQHLVSDRNNIVRICPSVSARFGLDEISELKSLKGLGNSEARKALPTIRPLFFETKAADDFTPFHT
jgi:patatin-like phospholipase/acyl hydrolase